MSATTASPSRKRSYAVLIERILPRHLLPGVRLAGLGDALARGDRARLYEETVAALLELQNAGLFTELPSPNPRLRVFQRAGDACRVRLEKPVGRLQQASRPNHPWSETVDDLATGAQARPAPADTAQEPQFEIDLEPAAWPPDDPQSRPTGIEAERGLEVESEGPVAKESVDLEGGGGAAATPAPVREVPAAGSMQPIHESKSGGVALAADETLARLEPFLELAGIESHLEPFGDRLRRIVAQLENSLPGARARLLCLDGEGTESLGDGVIQVMARAEADEMPHYREALRLGETQFATSAPVGVDPASGRIAAAVPLYVAGEPWGILQVTWPQGSGRSVGELARLLSPLARLVAMAIQNQTTLEKLVFIDPLTGVYNRAFYDMQLALEIERANRTNQKFALLVMDLDDFKRVNDQHGHRAGDHVLSQMAREVRARMRKIDLIFRYGGEEFVLLLPGAELEEAQRTAERLRLVASEQRFLPEGVPSPLRVTVSVGGAIYPDQSRTKTGIFNAADTALYRAKHEGKNRVAF
jgi:diguanylate cyclase (GGDEF)-like protein